jgi:hypothetical protein
MVKIPHCTDSWLTDGGKVVSPTQLPRSTPQKHDFLLLVLISDRLCGLVVRVLGYRSRGPGSIPGTTRFSEQKEKRKQ